MDINVAIQILSVIAESYATVLSIVSAFFIFFVEYHKRKEKEKEPLERKQADIIGFEIVYRRFDMFFIISIFEITFALMVMWAIGMSALSSEDLAFVISVSIVIAVAGFLSLFSLVMKIIERITHVVYI